MKLSMTSYGQRLINLADRLKWVNYTPFELHLYIGDNEHIPDNLTQLQKNSNKLFIHIVPDYKSLKKSYFALKDFAHEDIFMLDDDWGYTPNWIMYSVDNFIQHKRLFNNCVIGIIGYKIVKNNSGDFEFMMYGDAQNEFQKSLNYISGHCQPLTPSFKNVILSGGPGSWINSDQVHPDFFNYELYKELCGGTHDEIWNWIQSVRLGLMHVSLNTTFCLPPCIDTQLGPKLGETNTCDTSNTYMKKLLHHYPEVRRLLELS